MVEEREVMIYNLDVSLVIQQGLVDARTEGEVTKKQ